jgi:MYXO-CTERM domain-containing protein
MGEGVATERTGDGQGPGVWRGLAGRRIMNAGVSPSGAPGVWHMRFVIGSIGWMSLALVAVGAGPAPARACGGFFCGVQPVDQTAERIIFAVGEGRTDMIVQLSFDGKAADFAWVLPLAEVPVAGSLDVFPQSAMAALDAATGPVFMWDWGACWGDAIAFGSAPPSAEADGGGVIVHVREEVGPFEVVVIEGTDSSELVQWLRSNQFRVTEPMVPYIETYVAEGNRLLALRLQPGAQVSDIQPFRLSLPGEVPSIPIRITSVAAEPEMGILVFVLADRRFEPKSWPSVEVSNEHVIIDPATGRTNWAALVAQAVDAAGGQGFVTELAEPTDQYVWLLENSFVQDEEQQEALDALLPLLQAHPYITRMYTRLSPEEMASDPIFGRAPDSLGNVGRFRTIPMPADQCDDLWWGGGGTTTVMPCDFATCGAGGLCRNVATEAGGVVEGCACVPGATARTTFDPQARTTVICQDMRMSFLNPGDRSTPDESPLPDPCVGFDCGPGGECVAMNMTPTCQCAVGLVAIGWINEAGDRRTRCADPLDPVPYSFYLGRLPDLSPSLTPGREVTIVEPDLPGISGGGCAVAPAGAPVGWAWFALGALGLGVARRRRRA